MGNEENHFRKENKTEEKQEMKKIIREMKKEKKKQEMKKIIKEKRKTQKQINREFRKS